MEIIQRRLLTRSRGAQPQPPTPPTPSLLPSEYQRVSHLVSVGGAHISLNLPHKDYPSFKGSFCTTENTPEAFFVFGAKGTDTRAQCFLQSTKTQWGTHSNVLGQYAQYYAGPFYTERGVWHTFEIGAGYVTIDGETKTIAANFKESDISYILFGCNNQGVIEPYELAMGDLKAFIGQDTPTIARDVITCYRKSDGAGGFYDISGSICPLTGTPFYCNAGSGYFMIGDEI